LVHGHIDHLRSGGDDLDDPIVNQDRLLGCRYEIPQGPGLSAQALDRVHDFCRLVEKSLSQVGRPGEVIIEHPERGGIPGQGLKAIVPGLGIYLVHISALAQVAVGQNDLRGQRGCRQELRQ
jgi:hypothetical protein